MRPAGRVVERDDLHPVSELTEARRGRSAGQARTDHDYFEATFVRWVDELDLELVVVPFLFEWTGRNVGVERHWSPQLVVLEGGQAAVGGLVAGHVRSTAWSCTATGKLTLPTRISAANPCANR